MFKDLIAGLTREQMDDLKKLGVPQPRISEWRHGKGLPSRRAVLALAAVTGADAMTIEKEVMELELKPDERAMFRRLISGVMSVFIVFGVVANTDNYDSIQRVSTSHDAPAEYTS